MSKSNVQSKKKMFEKLLAPIRQKIVPARSKVAINKSLSKISERKSARSDQKHSNDEMLEQIFTENFEMAIALLPTVPFSMTKSVRKWIAVLLDSSAATPLQKRSAYLSFLIFQMQNMKITDPFDKEPPKNLSEASRLFSSARMKTMIDDMERKNRRNLLREGLSPFGLANFRTDFMAPPNFFEDQIFPNNGIICYGGCFSNYFH